MPAPHSVGKIQWVFVPIAIILAMATLRCRSQTRTPAEKLRVASAYQAEGFEPCYLCFARAGVTHRLPRIALYARKPSQDPAVGYCTIFICRVHPWPLEPTEQQQALRNWKDVQTEWWRPKLAGLARPGTVERAIRDFEGAVLTTPPFLKARDEP